MGGSPHLIWRTLLCLQRPVSMHRLNINVFAYSGRLWYSVSGCRARKAFIYRLLLWLTAELMGRTLQWPMLRLWCVSEHNCRCFFSREERRIHASAFPTDPERLECVCPLSNYRGSSALRPPPHYLGACVPYELCSAWLTIALTAWRRVWAATGALRVPTQTRTTWLASV